MSSFKNVDTVTTETSPLSSQDSRPLRPRLSLRAPGHRVWSEALLTPGPDLDQILEDLGTNQNYHGFINPFEDSVYLELLHDARFVVQVKVIAGVEHQHGGEADGEVVGVHLVPGGLRRHGGQVVQQVDQAVLEWKVWLKRIFNILQCSFSFAVKIHILH